MEDVVDAVVEIFAWTGFGLGVLLAGIALILYLFDGTWLPTRAVVELIGDDSAAGRHVVVRWFDESGAVNQAPLTAAEYHQLGEKDMADIFYRRGWTNRMRLTPGSPAVKAASLLAAGLVGVGAVALVLSWILLFARG